MEVLEELQIKELKDLKYLKNKLSIEGIDETEKLLVEVINELKKNFNA